MVLEQTRRMTVEEFDQFVLLPENTDKDWEFIAGEIVEVVSNDVSSSIGANLLGEIYAFNKVHQLGRVTGTTVWLFNPDDKQVEVYTPTQPVKVLGVSDTLDGGAVLPGFTLAVKAIFAV